MDQAGRTTIVQRWIDRLKAGDESAREELLECACDRLTRLARKMLKGYPGVARWEQTDDVLQNALVRLDRALKTVTPSSAEDFFRLAAAQIRRELIDLARHYGGPDGPGAHHASRAAGPGPEHDGEPAGLTHNPERLATWTEFHNKVGSLAEEDQQLFDLLWYQGITQAEAAELLGISERQVNRRWIAARLRLGAALGGQVPV